MVYLSRMATNGNGICCIKSIVSARFKTHSYMADNWGVS